MHQQYSYLNYHLGRGLPQIPHLAYADDVLIFCNGTAKALDKHIKSLKLYNNLSGQEVKVSMSYYISEKKLR